jgi:hypothetical protein
VRKRGRRCASRPCRRRMRTAPSFSRVLLLDRDGDPVMRLGLYGDDEVVAVWRRLGAETGSCGG